MNKNLSSKRNMYQVVLNILIMFTPIWTAFVAFATGVADFTNKFQEINDSAAEQQASLKSYTTNKRQKKRDMANKSLVTCGKVRAFCKATGNIILLGRLKISFSKLYYQKDATALGNAEFIYDSAQAMTPAERTAYDITGPELVALRAAIDAFGSLPSPAQVKAIRKQLTALLPQLFTEGTLILTDTLDGLMENYKESDPDFYEQYHNARRTYDSHRHTTVEGVTTDSETGEDLQNVQVLIETSAGNFEEMTDVQGKFKQQIEPEIPLKVKIILPDYESQEFDFAKLNRGEHEKLIVKLKKIIP